MVRSVWLGVFAVSFGAFIGCADEDPDDALFGPSPSGETGGVAASAGRDGASGGAAPTSGGAVNGGSAGTLAGGSPSGGSAGAPNGGSANGGSANGGSAGSASGGVETGGMPAMPGTGGRFGGQGGRGTFGGRSGMGGSGTGGETSSGMPGECSLTREGATGDESDGRIPVCCTPAAAESELIQEVFALLNEHRMANGESALAYDVELEATIQGHCVHMSRHDFFAHDAPEPEVASPWDRAELCGTNASGENIAQGQRTAADVMDDWRMSSGHNQNMLNSRFTRVGIGYAADGRVWGQIFGQ